MKKLLFALALFVSTSAQAVEITVTAEPETQFEKPFPKVMENSNSGAIWYFESEGQGVSLNAENLFEKKAISMIPFGS